MHIAHYPSINPPLSKVPSLRYRRYNAWYAQRLPPISPPILLLLLLLPPPPLLLTLLSLLGLVTPSPREASLIGGSNLETLPGAAVLRAVSGGRCLGFWLRIVCEGLAGRKTLAASATSAAAVSPAIGRRCQSTASGCRRIIDRLRFLVGVRVDSHNHPASASGTEPHDKEHVVDHAPDPLGSNSNPNHGPECVLWYFREDTSLWAIWLHRLGSNRWSSITRMGDRLNIDAHDTNSAHTQWARTVAIATTRASRPTGSSAVGHIAVIVVIIIIVICVVIRCISRFVIGVVVRVAVAVVIIVVRNLEEITVWG